MLQWYESKRRFKSPRACSGRKRGVGVQEERHQLANLGCILYLPTDRQRWNMRKLAGRMPFLIAYRAFEVIIRAYGQSGVLLVSGSPTRKNCHVSSNPIPNVALCCEAQSSVYPIGTICFSRSDSTPLVKKTRRGEKHYQIRHGCRVAAPFFAFFSIASRPQARVPMRKSVS